MGHTIPPIKDFPKDGRKWRLDWLGALRKNSGQSIEPTIDVIISPVESGYHMPIGNKGIISSEQRFIRVGSGLLPYLRIGSLWLDGRVLPYLPGQRSTFKNIWISAQSVREIKAGDVDENAEGKRYVIPPFVHSIGKFGLQASCLAVENNGDPYAIIIPTYEIIRFYYAGSTNLTTLAIFNSYNTFQNEIINPENTSYDEKNGICVLGLRKRIYDDDGWTIARILYDEHARQGIRKLHRSIVTSAYSKSPIFPTCAFPFRTQ